MCLRVVLADDEVLARQKVRQLLRSEQVEVVGECSTAAETIEVVKAASPDVLLLDIKMPDMDGFDVIGRLSSEGNVRLPEIIFTTAYDKYALQAFEINAADYLLKPFTKERLSSALERVRQRRANSAVGATEGQARPAEGEYLDRLVFKSKGRIVFLPVSEIHWISAEENYVKIHTRSEVHLLRQTMLRLEQKLNPASFLRVHRSYIVNLHFVREARAALDGEYSVILVGGQEVAMSRSFRSRLAHLLER